MLPKNSAAWYTRLSAVLPQSGAGGRVKLTTFSVLPAEARGLRCAMSFETFAGITASKIMNSYGKGTVKGNIRVKEALHHSRDRLYQPMTSEHVVSCPHVSEARDHRRLGIYPGPRLCHLDPCRIRVFDLLQAGAISDAARDEVLRSFCARHRVRRLGRPVRLCVPQTRHFCL